MRALALAFVPMFLLAGCSGSDAPADDGDGMTSMAQHDGHGGNMAGGHLLAPTWKLGDYWTISSPQGGSITHAVSGETSQDWIVDTDNADIAFFNALTDISLLGQVRKSDLAGSQGNQRVEFLRFPLQSNQSWSTTWDGETTMIHVGKVADGKAQLMAMRADGTTYAEYTYSDKARYFTSFKFYGPDGTTVGYEWTLSSQGTNFAGQLIRWSLTELFATAGPIPTGTATNFEVQPGFTDIYFTANLDCTAGAVTIAVGPFTGPTEDRGYSAQGPCPLGDASSYPITAPEAAENWGALVTGVPTTTGTLDLTVHGRVQTLFAVGAAPSL